MIRWRPRMKDRFNEYGFQAKESDSVNRFNIDFSVLDGDDTVAWAWGESLKDLDWECNHPNICIEYDDDETVGECTLCGSYCYWHKASDGEGNVYREPHNWYPRKEIGGAIAEYIKEKKNG